MTEGCPSNHHHNHHHHHHGFFRRAHSPIVFAGLILCAFASISLVRLFPTSATYSLKEFRSGRKGSSPIDVEAEIQLAINQSSKRRRKPSNNFTQPSLGNNTGLLRQQSRTGMKGIRSGGKPGNDAQGDSLSAISNVMSSLVSERKEETAAGNSNVKLSSEPLTIQQSDPTPVDASKPKTKLPGPLMIPLDRPPDLRQGVVRQEDEIYSGSAWDAQPIVVLKKKLLFFTIPKVGCTVWKRLFRRMMKIDNWWEVQHDPRNPMVHDPKINNLTYLGQYPLAVANKMMTSPNWTRAIFIREPIVRFLSAYLDKGERAGGEFIRRMCCEGHKLSMTVCDEASRNPRAFFNLTSYCHDTHWALQFHRMRPEQWRYINFVGRMSEAAEHAKALLQSLGGWRTFGQSGWGVHHNESIFESTSNVQHETDSRHKRIKFFKNDAGFEKMVRKRYAKDLKLYAAAVGGEKGWSAFMKAESSEASEKTTSEAARA